ncbi:hypothetical protein ACHAO7_011568 [Fusarium culmorum]
MDLTATTDAILTSSFPPAERSVIFQILVPDANKRDINRRAIRAGFIGNGSPQVCTFAALFVLSQGQLVDNGMPIFYSGESYKKLAGGDLPPPGSVTETFEDSGQLVFRNAALPNVAQCQNGQLVGDTLTSTVSEGKPSETTVSEEISSGSMTSIEDRTPSSSRGVIESTSSEESTNAVMPSASLSSVATTAEMPGILSTQPSVLSDNSSTELPTSSGHAVSTDSEISTSSGIISTGSTTTAGEEETSSNALERTSETTIDIGTTAIDTTTNTDIETTAPATETKTAINSDTTTESDTITTTEAGTTAAEITTALATTTSSAAKPCSDLSSPYKAVSGDLFTVVCEKCYIRISVITEPLRADSFASCIDACSLESECEAVNYLRT